MADVKTYGPPGYQFFMLVLCVYAIGAVAVQTATNLAPEIRGVIDYADHLICGIFFLDFIYSLWQAPDRWKYFVTWGWIDLLSSVPMLDFSRWGRLARIARVLRVLRMLRATRIVGAAILRKRTENALLAAGLLAILLVVFSSIAILQCETAPEANIQTAEDAIWWALTTITTVGYGDRFPVTSEGRAVAAILMIAGVALLSTLAGLLASWFMGPKDDGVRSELGKLREDIRAMREVIERLETQGK